MKAPTFIVLFILLFTNVIAQGQFADTIQKRDNLYKEYRDYKDTMTVRTWINLVNLTRSLETVVEFDGELIRDMNNRITELSSEDPSYQIRLQEISDIRDQLILDNNQLENKIQELESRQQLLYMAVGIAGILFLIAAVLLFIYYRRFIKQSKLEDGDMENAQKLKHQHSVESKRLKNELEQVQDENLLISNNLAEVKKAYEKLKIELDELEIKLEESEAAQGEEKDSIDYEDLINDFNQLNEEVESVIKEKAHLEGLLAETHQNYNQEVETRKKLEKELNTLIERLRSI